MTTRRALAAFEDGEALDARALAVPYREKAVKKIAKVMNGKRTPPHTVLAAANSMLALSDGRPAQQEPKKERAGLSITVNYLFAPNPAEHRIIPAVEVQAIEEAEVVAGDIAPIPASGPVPVVLAPRLFTKAAEKETP